MEFKNSIILGNDFQFHQGSFSVQGERFKEIRREDAGSPHAIDCEGCYVIPGLIDTHFHGNSGIDFSDVEPGELHKIAKYLAQNGITSFVIASLTQPVQKLKQAYQIAADFKKEAPEDLSYILGINMEGPFFSYAKRGAQPAQYLKDPDIDLFEELYRISGNLVRIVSVAPELPNALDFIRKAKKYATVSIAHTEADYDQAKAAIHAGATHVTHLFNAMPPFHHRSPGVIGAAAETPHIMVELISDGVHIHESAVRAVFQWFGQDRVILVSDSLSACGMSDGNYTSGGETVLLRKGAAVLKDGITLAGSTTNLYQCMKQAISFGVKAETAIKAATLNPAVAIGLGDLVGSIHPGKSADFLICDQEFNLRRVFIKGKEII